MTDRERLIELLWDVSYARKAEELCNDDCYIRRAADHLIANGVAVQKWIPVADRLPEENGAYLVATERGGVFVTHYNKRGQRFSVCRMGSDVTHWQERPMPPKEED